jgi:hypothetical protein
MFRSGVAKSFSDDEGGAIIIIAAFMMVALLGMTAIVFDLGLKRAERREVVTATDSGALAGAGSFAVGGDGCAVAANFVSATDPGATMPPGWCTHVGSGSYGVVSVRAEQQIEYAFAPVIGVDEGTTRALTMAAYGVPAYLEGGLRPFGLCLDSLNSHLTDHGLELPLEHWTPVIQIEYGKDDQPEACNGGGDIPGNWALIDFNGGDNSTGETAEWLQSGYDGPVAAGAVGGNCDDIPVAPAPADLEVCYDGDPGAWSNSLRTELDYLITAVDGAPLRFQLPLFDSGDAGGSNAYFHLVGFVSVELHGYKAVGDADLRWLEVSFGPDLGTGVLGDGSGLDTGTRVIAMCGVEAGNNC